jgi:protease I
MTKEKKRAVILVEDMYEDLEFWYPFYRLQEAGLEVTIMAPEKGRTYTSKHSYPVTAEAAPKDVEPSEVDVLVVPGGYAPDKLRRHDSIIEFVKAVGGGDAVVATICHGGWVLISAGLTKGKRMTSFFAIKDDLVNSGAEFVDEPVVVDGNLVSSRFPPDLPVFVKEILGRLS